VTSETEWQKSVHSFKRTITEVKVGRGVPMKMGLMGCSKMLLHDSRRGPNSRIVY
jgi:Mg-chelatase subunit ChlD